MSDNIDISISSHFNAAGATAARASLVDLNQSATQIVAALRAESVAAAETDTQFLAAAGAASKMALATGDAAKAEQILAVAAGEAAGAEAGANQQTLQRIQIEARALAAIGDRRGAINLLAGAVESQTERTLELVRAEIQLSQLENQAAAAATREADARLRAVQADARALATKKDFAGALTLLNNATAAETNASAGVIATVGAQTAQYEVAGTAVGALGAHVSALINPVLLATAALGAGVAVAKSFGDALHFSAELQEERTAFGGILGDFAQGNAILDEATARSRVYGFTQKEVTDAFRTLAPIIRESTSSTKDQTEALARISVLKPDKPVQALTSAIEGIKTGRFRELSKELGLSADEQASLKAQVDSGKDSFIALNAILDAHGITLDVARERTDGLIGAERRAQQAEEDLQKAQADQARGPGVAFVQAETVAYKTFVDLLNNQNLRNPLGFGGAYGAELVKFAFGVDSASNAITTNTAATNIHARAVEDDRVALGAAQLTTELHARAVEDDRQAIGQLQVASGTSNSELRKSADASAVDAAQKNLQQAATALVAQRTNDATQAFLSLNPNLDQAGVLSLLAAGKLDPLLGQLLLLKLRAQEARAALTGEALQNQTARELTGAGSDRADIEAGKHAGVVAGRAQGQAQAAAAAEARRQAEAAQGNLAPSIARAQAELSQLAKDGKQNTAEYIQKQQELNTLQGQQAAAGQKAIDDQIALAKATGDTVTARKLLNQELADAKASGDAGAQARIINEINGLEKTRTSGLSKQLNLQESIYDSINKQKDALLDIEELTIKDRQADRDAAAKNRTAQAIIKATEGRTDQRALDLRGRAQDVIALNSVEDRKRAQAIAEKQATANAGLSSTGKLLQSAPGGAISGPQPATSGSAPASAAPTSASGGYSINLVVDGKTLASVSEPYIMDALMKAIGTQKARAGA